MPSTRLEDCHPALKSAWEAFAKTFHAAFPGWSLYITCTYRPPEEEMAMFKKGRAWNASKRKWVVDDEDKVVTMFDGTKLRSFHNDLPARAIDASVVTPAGDEFTDPFSRGIAENEEGQNPWQWLSIQAPFYGLKHGPAQGTFRLS